MNLTPQPAPHYTQLDETPNRSFSLLPVFSGEAFRQAVQYPIIVEMWEKRLYGRVKRAWLATFTEKERNKISRYHAKFHRWHLVTGTPEKVSCQLKTLELLKRAVHFFATV